MAEVRQLGYILDIRGYEYGWPQESRERRARGPCRFERFEPRPDPWESQEYQHAWYLCRLRSLPDPDSEVYLDEIHRPNFNKYLKYFYRHHEHHKFLRARTHWSCVQNLREHMERYRSEKLKRDQIESITHLEQDDMPNLAELEAELETHLEEGIFGASGCILRGGGSHSLPGCVNQLSILITWPPFLPWG